MHRYSSFTLLLLALWLCPAPAAGADTAQLYDAWRNRVVQVQVIDLHAGSKAGIGSGFAAGRDGWIVTNYHVIAELVNQPGRYAARYLHDSGQQGELHILAVDAVHDLALLEASDLRAAPLELAAAGLPKGSRLYSMGYPFDIGLTIVEGTFNGMLEKSLYERLHFTGSINPGMSGGPALNPLGEVVGVNVATAGNQVSFLVPVDYVAALLRQASGLPAAEDELTAMVTAQLLENQQRIAAPLLRAELPRAGLGSYTVPGGMATFVNCWGNSRDDSEEELASVSYHCETEDDIYLSGTLSTGIIRYEHEVLATDSLHPMRFYRHLENRSYYPVLRLQGDEATVSNYRCHSDFIDMSGLALKATFCVRNYLQLQGLFDAYLDITSLEAPREALQSTLLLAGFSWENLTALSSRFIRSISRGDGVE